MATGALDNLRPDAPVRTSDGKEAGKLHAVIVDPRENRVTHIAVNTGPFLPEPGFGDPKIVAVDIDQVKDANDDDIVVSLSAADFGKLPLYEHTHFFDAPDVESEASPPALSRIWFSNLAIAFVKSVASIGGPTGVAIPAEHFQRASFERHILNDTPVWRIEPNTYIGDVERVLVNESTDVIESLVIRRGVLFPDDRILPMTYVKEIRDGLIHVDISDEPLDALQKYSS